MKNGIWSWNWKLREAWMSSRHVMPPAAAVMMQLQPARYSPFYWSFPTILGSSFSSFFPLVSTFRLYFIRLPSVDMSQPSASLLHYASHCSLWSSSHPCRSIFRPKYFHYFLQAFDLKCSSLMHHLRGHLLAFRPIK